MRDYPVNMSALRHQMRRMKLIKGVRLIHWIPEQTDFLLRNYKSMGNIEIAKKLNKMKLTKRKFNKKHIEKKMNLLGIKRSEDQLLFIKNKHKELGHYPGRVHAKEEGTVHVRIMNGIPHPHIKKGNFFVKQCREVYKQQVGNIPPGHMIHFKDYNTMNLEPSNLILKKVGDLTRYDKQKMLSIARENIERLNRPVIKNQEIQRASINRPDHKIKVIINPRLTLYVKPGTNIEALKAKYNRPLTINDSVHSFNF